MCWSVVPLGEPEAAGRLPVIRDRPGMTARIGVIWTTLTVTCDHLVMDAEYVARTDSKRWVQVFGVADGNTRLFRWPIRSLSWARRRSMPSP